MKLNGFLTFISAALAGLIAFGIFIANSGDTYRVLVTIGAALSMFVTLGGMIAVSSPNGGTMNIRVVSGLFFVALLITHIVFSFVSISLPPYVIITGLLLMVYLLICYGVMRALK